MAVNKKNIVSIAIIQSVLFMFFMFLAQFVFAAPAGKYVKYRQVTDKEVIIESNKGEKVLFTAYSNNSIGVACYHKGEEVKLIAPSEIISRIDLNGSIYVEEVEELVQITTTSDDGLVIRISRKPFGFTFFDKESRKQIVLNEDFNGGVVSKEFIERYQIAEENNDYSDNLNKL